MNSLYLENSIIGSLFLFSIFSTAIRSTQFLFTRLAMVISPRKRFHLFVFSPKFLILGDASLLEQLLPDTLD